MSKSDSKKAARVSKVESLENRRLMSVTYGTNLILNPGAENYDGTADGFNIITPFHWTENGDATVVQYRSGYGLVQGVRKPTNGGDAFFAGGPNDERTDFFQTIDLSSITSAIDAGQVNFALGAAIGGRSTDRDNAVVSVNFRDASQTLISQVNTADVSRGDRDNKSKFIRRTRAGVVPASAQFAQIQIHFKQDDGSYNDGYADNLSLALVTNTASTVGLVPAVLKNTLKPTAITGQKISGGLVLNLANTSTSINKGLDTVTLFASSNGAVDSNSVAIATVKRKLTLGPGKNARITVGVKSLSLPAGTYTIFAQTTDSVGTVVTAASGPTVTVAAPVISLSATVSALSPVTVEPGKFLSFVVSVQNAGNIPASGLATIALGLSNDGVTQTVPLTPVAKRLTVKAGGHPTTFRLKVNVPASQAPSLFFLIAVITQGINSATAVSATTFTVTD